MKILFILLICIFSMSCSEPKQEVGLLKKAVSKVNDCGRFECPDCKGEYFLIFPVIDDDGRRIEGQCKVCKKISIIGYGY